MTPGWPSHLFPIIDPPAKPGDKATADTCPSCRNTGYVLSHLQTRGGRNPGPQYDPGCIRCGRDPLADIAARFANMPYPIPDTVTVCSGEHRTVLPSIHAP